LNDLAVRIKDKTAKKGFSLDFFRKMIK